MNHGILEVPQVVEVYMELCLIKYQQHFQMYKVY